MDPRMYFSIGYREPSILHANEGMAAYACVWCRLERWVNKHRSENLEKLPQCLIVSSYHVRLNMYLNNRGSIGRQSTQPSNVCMVVHVHVVPDVCLCRRQYYSVVIADRIFPFGRTDISTTPGRFQP